MQIRVPVQQGIFLPESTSSAGSLTVPLFGHTNFLRTLIGMGSAALTAAVPYPGKVTRISHKGQRNTIKYINIYF